jgi:midasin (ATPase involved in ribosome maturation)
MKNLKNQIMTVAKKTSLIPFLKGPHGIGKTSLVRELAQDLKKSLVVFNLSAVDASDLTGLPIVQGEKMTYARPQFLDADIIFFDELDRVSNRDVKSALNSLLLDRAINGHALRHDQIIIAAGNYDSNNYETLDFDPSLFDRIVMLDFALTIDQRLEYFRDKLGQANCMTQFIAARPELFDHFSPRRLFQAASLFDSPESKHDLISLGLVESVLNRETKRLFEVFLADGLVSLRDLLDGKIDSEKLTSLSRLSAVNLITSNLSELINSIKTDEAKNVAAFIIELSPEEKATYFSKIKSLLLESKIEKDDLLKLNAIGFFQGQKTFLKELV